MPAFNCMDCVAVSVIARGLQMAFYLYVNVKLTKKHIWLAMLHCNIYLLGAVLCIQ